MDLIFNELSASELAPNLFFARIRMKELLETFKEARNLGVKNLAVRPDFYNSVLFNHYTIYSWLNDPAVSPIYKNLLPSITRYPYIKDGDDIIEEKFINSYLFLKKNRNIGLEGLAIAYFYNSIAISFSSTKEWDTTEIELCFIENENEDQIVSVRHVSNPGHLKIHKSWIEAFMDINLIPCNVAIIDKEIHLRDDHGKDILYKFAKKLRKSQYVLKIINSLPYNSFDTKFIKNCFETGIIEIVLTKTDKGLGLVIQTTGRNIIETEKIALLLKEDFDI